ncbi:radical SAM protein [Caldanaerobius polysaccharolyticus]|uniref:radical SAM protein n=1 Tax=Caldanaerobius polysaccharolyticus TaxID=44256 RepID=UPI0005551534|nr:radical SAM protein [Caldanaerobius polysaccharolyticus]
MNRDFGHPCFNPGTVKTHGRVHLPVAPRCNIKCKYCDRKTHCANENRPGLAAKVMSPDEALAYLSDVLKREPRISVTGIAGPGDPLYNYETFEMLRLIKKEFPDMILCLSTNGLLLYDTIYNLVDCGVSTLTVTINAVDPYIGEKIYEYVAYEGKTYRGYQAAQLLIEKQLEGIKAAVDNGLLVKINTVAIPGVNTDHVHDIAKTVKKLGVVLMNIMPLIPQGDFSNILPPDCQQLDKMRKESSSIIQQMYHCRQCRADASGLLE